MASRLCCCWGRSSLPALLRCSTTKPSDKRQTPPETSMHHDHIAPPLAATSTTRVSQHVAAWLLCPSALHSSLSSHKVASPTQEQRRTMNRLLVGVFALAAALQGTAAAAIEKDGSVLVLTDANFDDAIKEHSLLLVDFYAPWCGHCKKLEPAYSEAAATLAALDEPLYIAKLDATEHKEAAGKFEIRGFPTLKLFKNGVPIEYQGGRTAEDIANYMIKKSGPALSTISSVEEAEAFFAKHPKAALGMFDSLQSPAALGLAAYADKSDSFPLAYTADAAVLAKYQGGAGSLRFVTPEGVFSRALDFTEAEAADGELSMWLFGHSIPSLVQFSAEKSMELFSGPIRVHLIAFGDEATAGYGAMVAAVKEGAGKHRTEALSILVGKNETRILEAFELTEADVPKVVIADMRAGSMKRFFFEGDLTKAGEVEAFLADFLVGNLKAKLKSEEPAPEDMAGPVKVIKGKSFQAQVLDSDKDVLIEFYAPWCGHCKTLEPKWDVLGEKLSAVEHVMIAKMDYTANELDVAGIDIKGFPTILFFPAANKAEPVVYQQEREVNAFVAFLKEHASKPFEVAVDAVEEEDEEEEKDEL